MAEVFVMAYPTVVTMFTYAVMSSVDTMMVGRLGVAELGAVGLVSTLYMTMIAIFLDTVEIVNTFASQSFGEGKPKEAAGSAWQGVYLALLFWPVLIGATYILDDLMRLMGPSERIQVLGFEYGRIRLYGTGLFLLYIAVASFFRGVGMVRTPMVVAIVMNVVNVGLDYVMIFGKLGCPAMGISGAAWASNISLLLGATIMFVAFLQPRINRRFSTRRAFAVRPRLMARHIKVGLPAGIHFFVDSGSFTIFASMLGRMGDVALASSQVAFQAMAISFNTCWGVSVATTTLVGQYIGAGRPAMAGKAARSAARMVLMYVLTLAVILTLFTEPVIGLFTRDEAVIATGALVMYMAITFLAFDGVGVIAVGGLRGAGDTRWPMVVSLLGAWGVFLPLAYLLGIVYEGGVLGAWLAAAVWIIGVSMAFILRFRSGRWKQMSI